MLIADLTVGQLNAFTDIERAASVLSLLGCVLIIGTFCGSRQFHKPINRLVLYASMQVTPRDLGNMMTNVATLMARTYVSDGNSPGCQFQGFLIQMFMPADAFWTLAMAVNVYLTFYRKYDAQMLRKMELPYLLFCYGLPFIVALTYIFIKDATRGRMYGNATLWCWIQQSWDIWRIATFYGPVWVTIVITFIIYIRAGREIYRKHQQLKDLNYTSHHEPEPLPINDALNHKTTEVSVTVSNAQEGIDLATLGFTSHKHESTASPVLNDPETAYTVSISAQPPSKAESSSMAATNAATKPKVQPQPTHAPKIPSRRKVMLDAHNAAWSYTKVALLFFTAMLVTWIPSSLNRLYSLAKPGQINLPLEYMSACVLPLQGFWNAVIYILTSWQACKDLFEDTVTYFKSSSTGVDMPRMSNGLRSRSMTRLGSSTGTETGTARRSTTFGRGSKDSETESMEELANSAGSMSQSLT
ncbi:hypothetical protein BD289DRAFT_459131 [Coniella lustricola]|uniref:G-protein coupled receptors family 2 profile 2 domain-containing protein n=1 Tax=Coniella lustricola TaxID=2025994 RepID=A0A2T3AGB5_9PEZI|nr:hypothetical protein BD289DRAFT_459131 [Coniella lustricola]